MKKISIMYHPALIKLKIIYNMLIINLLIYGNCGDAGLLVSQADGLSRQLAAEKYHAHSVKIEC